MMMMVRAILLLLLLLLVAATLLLLPATPRKTNCGGGGSFNDVPEELAPRFCEKKEVGAIIITIVFPLEDKKQRNKVLTTSSSVRERERER